jgi:hydroxymethylglutaryl-CoA reductase
MMIEGLMLPPLRSLIVMSKGEMPANKARALAHIANGKILRGKLELMRK